MEPSTRCGPAYYDNLHGVQIIFKRLDRCSVVSVSMRVQRTAGAALLGQFPLLSNRSELELS